MKGMYIMKGNRETGYRIDGRSRKDLLDMLRALAESYVPEWKFDTDNPDPLSVIARIFANQTEENIKRLNMVMHKYHIEFANMYGMSRKPAIPARTICALDVGGGNPAGVELKQGAQVVGTTQDGDEIIFSFVHDINAINAELTDVIEVTGKGRKAVSYSVEDGFPLFSYQGENLHRQAVVLHFDRPFDSGNRPVRLRFGGNLGSGRLAELFADRELFSLYYITGEGAAAFDTARCAEEFVELRSGQSEGLCTAAVLEMTGAVEENIALNSIELYISQEKMRPEFLWNGRSEVMGESFCPFTEQPALYGEFFIGQELLLSQRGAELTISFRLAFERFTASGALEEQPELKVIKRKTAGGFRRPHYRCYIQEITLEYFNGRGWKRLPTNLDISALFAREENAGYYDISFEAPPDWESVVQGGYEGRCVRMQIVRADNCYMQEVEYVYPVLSDFGIRMSERSRGILPRKIIKLQGTRETDITAEIAGGADVPVFSQLAYGGDYVYWGFDRPLGSGPVSIFAELERSQIFKNLELSFAYSAASGFKPLKVLDDTESFQHSGRLMFVPPPDLAEREIEGIRRYWIRIEDGTGYFADTQSEAPFVRRIYKNAVMAENVVEKEEQDYYLEAVTPNMRFPLYSDNILSVEVWVNEKEQLSVGEMKALMRDKSVKTRVEYNFLGEIEEFYILWSEVDSFENRGDKRDTKRCYCIDRGRSEIVFGDGVQVKVPLCLDDIAFKTKVICCDGEKANIRAGGIDRFRGTVISVETVQNPIDAYGGTNLEELEDALERGSNILSSRGRMVSERDYVKETLAFSDVIEQVKCVTGLMRNGARDDAVISLVLLMKDYQQGSYSFRGIQGPLQDYLMNRCEITCGISDVQIVEPVFVKISVDIWLHIPDLRKSLEVKHRWLREITEFLEPVRHVSSGGWQIGTLPSTRQIRLMLGSLEDTARIAYMNVTAQYSSDQRDYTMGLDSVEKNPFMLCCNGTHNVYLSSAGHTGVTGSAKY